MSINKAKGQTLQCAGVLLDEPVLTSARINGGDAGDIPDTGRWRPRD